MERRADGGPAAALVIAPDERTLVEKYGAHRQIVPEGGVDLTAAPREEVLAPDGFRRLEDKPVLRMLDRCSRQWRRNGMLY